MSAFIEKPHEPAPMGRPYRVSSDKSWSLRDASGRTFAERKAEMERRSGR